MSSPLVSMCVPVYNHASYVTACLSSIIAQRYDNIELIVIDDGSQDASAECVAQMVAECEKRFVRFKFISRPNKGLSRTLNEAIEWAEGEYFCALASDDMILPSKTDILVAHLEKNPSCVAVFGSIYLVDEHGVRKGERKRQSTYTFDDVFLLKAELPAPASLMRLSSLKEQGGFNVETRLEDLDMWLKLTGQAGRYLEVLPVLLAEYRLHPANNWKQVDVMYAEQLRIIQAYQDNPLFSSAKAALDCSRFRNLASLNKKSALQSLGPLLFRSSTYREMRFYQGFLHLMVRW
ncbi:glycosyltransferase [Pseudomonas wadenswilerensis]|uniref:glycosyltransferase n=1 Tax=Pseudomonas wadenswilerensis TaxID=1785161 RepID=UPI00320838D4